MIWILSQGYLMICQMHHPRFQQIASKSCFLFLFTQLVIDGHYSPFVNAVLLVQGAVDATQISSYNDFLGRYSQSNAGSLDWAVPFHTKPTSSEQLCSEPFTIWPKRQNWPGQNAGQIGQHMEQAHLFDRNLVNGNEAHPLEDRTSELVGLYARVTIDQRRVNETGANSTDRCKYYVTSSSNCPYITYFPLKAFLPIYCWKPGVWRRSFS